MPFILFAPSLLSEHTALRARCHHSELLPQSLCWGLMIRTKPRFLESAYIVILLCYKTGKCGWNLCVLFSCSERFLNRFRSLTHELWAHVDNSAPFHHQSACCLTIWYGKRGRALITHAYPAITNRWRNHLLTALHLPVFVFIASIIPFSFHFSTNQCIVRLFS